MNAVTMTAWGFATSVRDGGRVGRAGMGASRGGAVDRGALGLANRLVGNADNDPALETSGGLRLVVERPVMLALTGAVADVSVVDGPPLGWGAPVALPAGATVTIGRLTDGARVYVAIRGGVTRADDGLLVGPDTGTPTATESAPRAPRRDVITIWPGPRQDWFAPEAWSRLISEPFTVSAHTDRVGSRLTGPTLDRIVVGELPSEGVIEGAIQVPPDGQPIVMLADHPTTGGYPVIAVVDPDDITYIAQAAAGTVIRFRAAR